MFYSQLVWGKFVYFFSDKEFLLMCSLKLSLIIKLTLELHLEPYVVPICTNSFKVLERHFTSNPQIYFWVCFGVIFLPTKAALVLLGQPWIEELNGAHDGDEAKAYTFKRQYHRRIILISAKPIEQKISIYVG